MKTKQRSIFILILLLKFIYPSLSGAETRLTVLYINEYHGTALPDEDGRGGLAYQATVINQIRAKEKNVLLLNSGDLLVGTLMSAVFRGVPDVLAMNLMKFDAVTVGNHEFDFGLTAFQNLRDLARFPFLSANLVTDKDLIKPWIIREFDGLTVAILGLTTAQTREIVDPMVAKQITLLDPIPVARQMVQTLKGQADLIIALTHQDNAEDLALAKAVPEIDVIVGGHTEGFEGLLTVNQPTPVKKLQNPPTLYVKTHRLGKALGKLDLTIENGKILSAQVENIPIDSRKLLPDEEVAHLLKFYSDQLTRKLDTIIGKAQVKLNGERHVIRSQESNLGNLIADIIRDHTQTDISFVNAGSIRSSIKEGEITLGDLYRVFPFVGNTVVTFKLAGEDIWEALENSVSQVEKDAGRFLQVSGLTYTYDPNAPLGHRILEVKVNGTSLVSDHIYSVSTTNYLAEGGDGYIIFRQNRKEYTDTKTRLIDLLTEYVQKAKIITPRTEGRIVKK